jgi:hypothetical protein
VFECFDQILSLFLKKCQILYSFNIKMLEQRLHFRFFFSSRLTKYGIVSAIIKIIKMFRMQLLCVFKRFP